MSIFGWSLICLTFGLFDIGDSYEDGEYKCSKTTERVTVFRGIKDKTGMRVFSFQCKPFLNEKQIKNVKCHWARPYNCNNLREGCNVTHKNEWLGGAKWFDMGAGSPMLVPYCCSSENVEIDNCAKSQQVNKRKSLNEMFWADITDKEVGMITRCVLVLERDNASSNANSTKEPKVLDSFFNYQRCNYKVNKKYPSPVQLKLSGSNKGKPDDKNDPPIKDDCGCSPEKCIQKSTCSQSQKKKKPEGTIVKKSKKVTRREAPSNKTSPALSPSCTVCVCNTDC